MAQSIEVGDAFEVTNSNAYDEMIEGFISFELEQIHITDDLGDDIFRVHHSNKTIGVGTERDIDGSALRSLVSGGYLVPMEA